MNESLIKSSFNRFKNNVASYIAIGVMCGLFLILVSTLSFIDEFVFLLAIPLLALPTLFASHISGYLLEAKEPVTIQGFFRYFISFFRPQFRSSFRGIISFLISLGVYVGGMMLAFFAMYLLFKSHYGATFLEPYNHLIEQYLAGGSYEELMEVLKENGGILLTFLSFITALPLPLSIVTFVVLVSYNSISVYYRVNITSGAPSLIRLGISTAYQNSKKTMFKDWLKLNWWLILLPLLGSLIASVICVFALKAYTYLPAFATVGAFIPLVFFLPFYFPNMEVLYHRYEEAFRDGNKKAIKIILERIETSIELSEEEKRKLEESFLDDSEMKE